MKTVLTIAGSDSIGGAGMQADIKTIMAHGAYGMTAITAVTAQNTKGVESIEPISSIMLEQQLKAVFEDIFPDAVKIGMICSADQAKIIAEVLQKYTAKNVVVDPVMASTSGKTLAQDTAVKAMEKFLFPLATVVTPNIPEARKLWEGAVETREDREKAAVDLAKKYGSYVLCKGGHEAGGADDLLTDGSNVIWLSGKRIQTTNSHGTGCTLSSAIAANLAKEMEVAVAVKEAKAYITGALAAGLDIGKGNGPLHHGFALTGEFFRVDTVD